MPGEHFLREVSHEAVCYEQGAYVENGATEKSALIDV